MGNERVVSNFYQKIKTEISKAVIGKADIIENMVIALIAGGHVLVEGFPGTAKTTLAKSFAKSIGGDFKRIQFTPDMMPADVTGFYIYSPGGESRFISGPIFANMVLADELNRTTPRTQSALLEAMQESQVSIEGRVFPLPKPFMVIATQLQAGSEGTYPLTSVQIDRFMLSVTSEYSTHEEERNILSNYNAIEEPDIKAVATFNEIQEIQNLAKNVQVKPDLIEYIMSIIDVLRNDSDILTGISTRASIALLKCSRVKALLDSRNYVIPDDIKHLVLPIIRHRIKMKPEAELDEITPNVILERALSKVPVPRPTL